MRALQKYYKVAGLLFVSAVVMLACLYMGAAWFKSPRPFDEIKRKLAQGNPVTVLVWSDSTGNGEANPREWPYLLGDWLSARYPESPVQLWQWLEEPEGYTSPVALAVGNGGPAITLANFAVPGANMEYGTGKRWQPAMARWNDPDLVIVNLGLNYAGYEDDAVIRPLFQNGLDRLQEQFPATSILVIRQNPFSDNSTMDYVYRVIDDLALERGIPTADVAGLYDAHSGGGLYLGQDNTHPSQVGQELYLEAITSLW